MIASKSLGRSRRVLAAVVAVVGLLVGGGCSLVPQSASCTQEGQKRLRSAAGLVALLSGASLDYVTDFACEETGEAVAVLSTEGGHAADLSKQGKECQWDAGRAAARCDFGGTVVDVYSVDYDVIRTTYFQVELIE